MSSVFPGFSPTVNHQLSRDLCYRAIAVLRQQREKALPAVVLPLRTIKNQRIVVGHHDIIRAQRMILAGIEQIVELLPVRQQRRSAGRGGDDSLPGDA